jgi:hypothetical protein
MRCRISEDVYQFTLLFFVPDVVYLFICPLLFYVRGFLTVQVHCPLKLNVWGCLTVHLPPTLVFKRKSTCPFFYHFCKLQVVYLFTCLPLPHVRGCLPIRLPSSVVRQICLSFHLPSAECLMMSTFPFAFTAFVLYCFTIKEDVYLQIRYPLLNIRTFVVC